jgi:hypothetical protein
MLLPITALTAALVTFGYVGLGLWVIYLRRTGAGPSVGMTGDERFTRAVRAHGNLGEYAPLFLLLLGVYEIQGGHHWLLVGMSTLFVLSRLLHAVGFGFLGRGPWRTIGMIGTNATLLTLATFNMLLVF